MKHCTSQKWLENIPLIRNQVRAGPAQAGKIPSPGSLLQHRTAGKSPCVSAATRAARGQAWERADLCLVGLSGFSVCLSVLVSGLGGFLHALNFPGLGPPWTNNVLEQ